MLELKAWHNIGLWFQLFNTETHFLNDIVVKWEMLPSAGPLVSTANLGLKGQPNLCQNREEPSVLRGTCEEEWARVLVCVSHKGGSGTSSNWPQPPSSGGKG